MVILTASPRTRRPCGHESRGGPWLVTPSVHVIRYDLEDSNGGTMLVRPAVDRNHDSWIISDLVGYPFKPRDLAVVAGVLFDSGERGADRWSYQPARAIRSLSGAPGPMSVEDREAPWLELRAFVASGATSADALGHAEARPWMPGSRTLGDLS